MNDKDAEKRGNENLFAFLAFLAFLGFLFFLKWQIRQAPTITQSDIEKAREIARRVG